ncbi:hypothetical protein BURK_034889 [Burkholderia sp. SJ98]|nr:hypothetical protein BURK_034889 [Burkholderia sp. SJ98]
MLLNGMETLVLRVEKQSANALEIARCHASVIRAGLSRESDEPPLRHCPGEMPKRFENACVNAL